MTRPRRIVVDANGRAYLAARRANMASIVMLFVAGVILSVVGVVGLVRVGARLIARYDAHVAVDGRHQ